MFIHFIIYEIIYHDLYLNYFIFYLMMKREETLAYIDKEFDTNVIPTLMEYIKIDNLSPFFDPQWETNGKLEKAAQLIVDWVNKQNVKGLKASVIKDDKLSPVIWINIDSNGGNGNVLMYGHFDKQPHFDGWIEGTGPTTPKIIGDLLYGRGGADDGYATFASVLSIKALQQFDVKHGTINILIEGSEESGSPHLMHYVEKFADKIGTPDLLVCLDSGCKDYERIWITSSLRGNLVKNIKVECLKESLHSGGTGHAPDSFTVIRQLLDRLEDSKTSEVVKDFHVEIPDAKYKEAKNVTSILGEEIILPKRLEGVKLIHNDLSELYLNGTWRPTLCILGQTGLPSHLFAGNVLRESTTIRLSMRIPPTLNADKASEIFDQIILSNPPYNAKISIESRKPSFGWAAKEFSQKLYKSLSESSLSLWGEDCQTNGEGGTIPFINSLSQKFENCDFLVIGVLGPGSNAHAANETLNIPYCKKLITALVHALSDKFN